MKQTCVLCGKPAEKLYEHICEPCYIAKHPQKASLPENVDAEICADCGGILIRGKWREVPNDDEKARVAIMASLKHSRDFALAGTDIELRWEDVKNVSATVKLKLKRDGIVLGEDLQTRVRFKKNMCQACSRVRGSYYEAILQLRGRMEPDFADTVSGLIESHRKTIISKTLFVRGGVDFYISNMNIAKQVAHELAEDYGSEYGESAKLYGMKEGKKVYRLTYLVRMPEYHRDDFVILNDKLFRIKSFTKKQVHALNMSVGANQNVDRKDMAKAMVLGGEEILETATVLTSTETELQIMDPANYSMMTMLKPKGLVLKGETVKILRCDLGIFIVV
jgi:nonsense-mediated mRNA decay protein 3